ncbi:MAG TPA: hypothetical protein VIT68_00920 [Candidatus Gracilibacteria bacterium]
MYFAHFVFRSFLEDGERIIMIFRRPFLFVLMKIKWRIVLWGGLTMLFWFLDFYGQDWIWMFFLVVAIYKVAAGFFWWYTRAILMTSEGLIFVYWPRFFYRRADRIDWHNLDEIEVERIGAKSFALNYGTLRFQKVNGGEQIEEKCMASPNKTGRKIENFKELMLDEKNFMEESALKDLLGKVALKHVEDHGQPSRPQEAQFNKLKERVHGKKEQEEEPKNQRTEEPKFSLGNRDAGGGKKSHKITGGEDVDIEKELDDTGGIELDL